MHARRMLALLSLLITTSLFAAPPTNQSKPGSDVRTTTLANGMKVIVWPDSDIPNVAMYIWYKAGARNERPGITGLSHFFEHMMFNGAKKYGPGEFDRVMEANGGANNAYTSSDVTVYQNWFPRSAMELIFDLEADRIQHLAFDDKIIESERGVVYSERRLRTDNSNQGLLNEQVQATAFVAHPYQFPVIGWPSDIESWTKKDLQDYFRTYYAPNNATMIVVGDVTPDEVFALAKKYIEPIPAQKPPEPVRTVEPEQTGERRVTITKDAQVPLVQIAYHIGSARDADAEALDLLFAILTRGDSSRLHQRLVEQEQIALGVGGFLDRGFDPGLAWVAMTLSANADTAKAEAILDEELAKIGKDGPTAAELTKAKNIQVADFWRSLKTISGKAQAVGSNEVFRGDWEALFSAPARYEAVTAEQIKQVAARVFRNTNRTVGVLTPPAATPESKEAAR
ncbi:MAG: insulinase family protein [Thermoanaerobaculia bacterium]|nr:insulinase family protein [Thermoanaerobaculia bacterium]